MAHISSFSRSTHGSAVRRSPVAMAAAAVALSAVLAACGGGGGDSGSLAVNNPVGELASGIVTGFGSVYVDGVKLEDAKAATVTLNADGTTTNTALRLGQRVRAEHDGKGTASRVVVDAAVIGAVSVVDATAGTFKVAGQTVKANADSAAGPVTVYAGGYTALADVAATDLVEVHGTPVYDSVTKVYTVQATRIEKRTSIAAVRVTGAVSALDTTAKTFVLNGVTVSYGSATLLPASAALAVGQSVVVWAKTYVSGTTLAASGVRVVTGAKSDLPAATVAQLAGVVSQYDAVAGSFQVSGVTVKLASATTIMPSSKTVGNNAYVQVGGTVQADGSLLATAVRIRQSDTVDDAARIRLNGAISSLVNSTSFVVRGVPVDAPASALQSSCTGITLADGVVVDVVATPQTGTDVVLASRVDCRSANAVTPAVTIRELRGVPSVVDATAKTFTLTTTRLSSVTTQSVSWTDQTVWGSTLTAATLASQTAVAVEGYLDSAGVLIARELRVPGTRDADAYDLSSATGLEKGWGRYDSKIRGQRK
jgi:Domain of unknown function (DUF5666)